MAGTLYIVATPIGNLEDITLRALSVLRQVDAIACEDTRHTLKLLSHFQIAKPLVSYHEHNERERTRELLEKLKSGLSIALVSDAGTPLVSDPGYNLVGEAIREEIRVVPIPGPSALITALAASGLPMEEFLFAGFLPSKRSARRSRLSGLAVSKATLVFYEAPHRIRESLEDALDLLGDRQAVLGRELTKIHEEFERGRLSELLDRMEEKQPRGEYVVMIAPAGEEAAAVESTKSIAAEVRELMNAEDLDQKAALKRVARSRGISRSEAYRRLMAETRE